MCVCERARSHNFKQSLATRSSDVAGSPASEPERAMIDAGASGWAGRTEEGWDQGTGCWWTRKGGRERERERERERKRERERERGRYWKWGRSEDRAWGNLINVNAAATAGATHRVWQSLICNSTLPPYHLYSSPLRPRCPFYSPNHPRHPLADPRYRASPQGLSAIVLNGPVRGVIKHLEKGWGISIAGRLMGLESAGRFGSIRLDL